MDTKDDFSLKKQQEPGSSGARSIPDTSIVQACSGHGPHDSETSAPSLAPVAKEATAVTAPCTSLEALLDENKGDYISTAQLWESLLVNVNTNVGEELTKAKADEALKEQAVPIDVKVETPSSPFELGGSGGPVVGSDLERLVASSSKVELGAGKYDLMLDPDLDEDLFIDIDSPSSSSSGNDDPGPVADPDEDAATAEATSSAVEAVDPARWVDNVVKIIEDDRTYPNAVYSGLSADNCARKLIETHDVNYLRSSFKKLASADLDVAYKFIKDLEDEADRRLSLFKKQDEKSQRK